MPRFRAAILLLLISASSVGASPQLAKKIEETWEIKAAEWKEAAAKAVTPEQREAVLKIRPKQAAYASRMWGAIEKSLEEPWTIEFAAWFLQMSDGIKHPEKPGPLFAAEIEKTKKAILAFHARRPDPQLNKLCLAMTLLSDPMTLSILEKIEQANPDPQIQGVAALSAALVIKGLGDDTELMRKRLTYIRKAIINSADVQVGETSIAKLAENELYQIRFLSKGRIAPDIAGMDSTGKGFVLSQHTDRITILIFWSSTIEQAEHTIEFTNEMTARFKDKPVQVIGINHDPIAKLRAMRVDETVKWRNLTDPDKRLSESYRVGTWPMVYVLDHKQKIHYAGVLGSFAELTADALITEIQ